MALRGIASSSAHIQAEPQPSFVDKLCLQIAWPLEYTQQRIEETKPILKQLTDLPVTKSLFEQNKAVRKEFHWPAGKRRIVQAPETLTYGALMGSGDLPLVPLVFKWRPRCTPSHVNSNIFGSSFADPQQQQKLSQMQVPGVTMLQYLGPNLGLSGTHGVSGSPRAVHPGVPTAFIDDVTARVGFSNSIDKPIFTANFQLEYLEPVLTDSFVVMDAWITAVEGRKSYIASYLADATTGKVLVKAKSLFVSAA
ncbi:hypothetical protein LPJ66_001212 [Kickxella alabastrina]|uniref:Uncharacterized protein n=1 Tax=Kickxella alabastrina TaxID=61397 RepID=A0ACC1IU75_9FUNG|nr:hypothetical protein LPJ66_001212 [Kickxella alabastrina]